MNKQSITRLIDYLFNKYEWLLSFLLKFHPVKVNHERYVRRVVRSSFKGDTAALEQQALDTSVAEVLDEQQQRRCYRRILWRYGTIVFVASFLLTLVPDDMIYVIISGALDLLIFQCMLFVAMQKILILYGRHCDLVNDEVKSVERIIAIDSSGLMIGKYPILQKMKSVLGWLGKQVVKRLGPQFVTRVSRSAFIVIRRQAIKWFSIVIAKEHVDFIFNAIIPLTCAFISGLVSVVIFVPMCNKLRRHLVEHADDAESQDLANFVYG